jgi:hypothetical protein
MRINPGTKREKRPGPHAADEIFKSLGLAYALNGRRLSLHDRHEVDRRLGIKSLVAAKKASEWLKPYVPRPGLFLDHSTPAMQSKESSARRADDHAGFIAKPDHAEDRDHEAPARGTPAGMRG